MDIFSAIIKFDKLYEASEEMFGFGDVTLLRDFGPLKEGERVDGLWFKLTEGIVEVYCHGSGDPTNSFPFRLEA